MDTGEYKTLLAALAAVPDPRQRRGQRYPWLLLLGLLAAAVASGQPHGRAIGQWVQEHGADLQARLGWTGRRLPRAATLRRALLRVDLAALERQVGRLVQAQPAARTAGRAARALDGKVVRGAGAHGQRVWLVGLADEQGQMRAQTGLATGQTERSAARELLRGRDLLGQVVTADAAFTDVEFAGQLRAQRGDYLFVVKGNRAELRWALVTEFAGAHWLVTERAQEYGVVQTEDAGHGRWETRTLEASTRLNTYLAEVGWPDVGQVLRRTCRRVVLKTGEVTVASTYAITSLSPQTVPLAAVEALWRGHWSIENRVHHVRDVSFHEDAGQAHTGHIAHALAALRNGVLTCLRAAGWTRIAAALRPYAAHLDEALMLIGVSP